MVLLCDQPAPLDRTSTLKARSLTARLTDPLFVSIACPAGMFSEPGATSCSACAAGKFAAIASSTCTDCPAGSHIAQSTSNDAIHGVKKTGASCTVRTSPKPEHADVIKKAHKSHTSRMFVFYQQACAAGKVAPPASDAVGDCTNCAAGKYIAQTTTTVAGVSQTHTAAACTDCPAGSHSAAAAASCTVRCTWLGVSCLLGDLGVAAGRMHALMCGAFFPYQGDLRLMIAVCSLYLNRPARPAR